MATGTRPTWWGKFMLQPHREPPARRQCGSCAGGGEINGIRPCRDCGGRGYFEQNPQRGNSRTGEDSNAY